MRWTLRIFCLFCVFATIGWMAEHIVMEHAHVRTPGYEPVTLLAAHTAGLFAGGAATVIVFIGMLVLDGQELRRGQRGK